MKKIGIYLSIFLAGALSAFIMVFYSQKPSTVINADTYIEKQKQKIGKIKQKGTSNVQDNNVSQGLTKKKLRKNKRLLRKANR